MKLIIEQINNKWTVNGRLLHEMTEVEKHILVKFLKSINERIIEKYT